MTDEMPKAKDKDSIPKTHIQYVLESEVVCITFFHLCVYFCVAAYLSVFVMFVFSCESATCVHLELCVSVSHICKSLLHFFQYFRVSVQAAFFAL